MFVKGVLVNKSCVSIERNYFEFCNKIKFKFMYKVLYGLYFVREVK